jgi:bifunctional non-homologous end joining protein LigD
MQIEGREIEISNPNKILFPKSKITKQEFVEYYHDIGPIMVEYLKGRALTVQRYPDGINGSFFFQKTAPEYYPKYIDRVRVKEDEDYKKYAIINNVSSLVYIAGQAAIPMHVSSGRKGSLQKPDHVIWDLDPSDDDFEKVRKGAFLIKEFLEMINLQPSLKTTGSKGIHLVVPLIPKRTYTTEKAFSKEVAEIMVKAYPQLFTLEMLKKKRQGRIFLDYLRNQFGHTAVAAYSVRPIEGAPVGCPITWDELKDKSIAPQTFNIRNMRERIEKVGDLWAGFYERGQDLDAAILALKELKRKMKGK